MGEGEGLGRGDACHVCHVEIYDKMSKTIS